MQRITFVDSDRTIDPGKILCIGRNYARHAAEMGSAVPEEPMVFLKPASALIASSGSIVIPTKSTDVHHEVELVVLVGNQLKHVSPDEAMRGVGGYAVGLDMTARDLQAEAKRKGTPWTVAKGFDTFAPLGEMVDTSTVPDPQALEIKLTINGSLRQHGSTSDMIFPVGHLLAYCSTIFTLYPGDLLYTGTPDGVGPVLPGDQLVAEITGLPPLSVSVRTE